MSHMPAMGQTMIPPEDAPSRRRALRTTFSLDIATPRVRMTLQLPVDINQSEGS